MKEVVKLTQAGLPRGDSRRQDRTRLSARLGENVGLEDLARVALFGWLWLSQGWVVWGGARINYWLGALTQNGESGQATNENPAATWNGRRIESTCPLIPCALPSFVACEEPSNSIGPLFRRFTGRDVTDRGKSGSANVRSQATWRRGWASVKRAAFGRRSSICWC